MTQFLPPNLLALFAPRDPAPYLPPTDKLSHEKRRPPYLGVAQYLGLFEDPKDTPPPTRAETREERRERKRREKAEQVTYKLEQEIAKWEPTNNPASTTDAFKTLFVARINYDTSESKLRREFEAYGAIRKIILVSDEKSKKQRGYAFIEYEHERDMHSAYKHADGKKIDGKRVLVDVERARTVKGWLPRRLGGGLGGTRRGGPEVNVKHSGREDNERERDRYLEREKVKERERERELESTTPRGKRRSRSPRRDHGDRDKEREKDRKHRSKSRERKRKRSRSRDRDGERDRGRDKDKDKDRERDKESRPDKEPRPDKDRKRSRRSRSRDGDRKKDRREKDRDRRDSGRPGREEQVRIKEEPMDDYPEYNGDGGYQYDPNAVKYEETDPNAEYEFQPENY